MQEQAWAGELSFIDETAWMRQYDDAYFTMKNELGVLTEKTVRDLKFVQKDWKDRVHLDIGDTRAKL